MSLLLGPLGGKRSFNPRQELFSNNEQGLWLDPSDMTAGKAGWRRNLLTYSEQFDNAAWTKNYGTVSANSTNSPFSEQTADTLTQSGGTVLAFITRSPQFVLNQTYTISCYAKKSALRDYLLLEEWTSGSARRSYFDVNSGSTFSINANHTAQIQNVGNGWYRCSISFTSLSGSNASITIGVANGATTSVPDDGGSMFLFGAQLELGTLTDYQRITDFATEFKQAFPTHTLYQDSNGVTPCTAAGDQVGLILDQSRGGLANLGPEIVTNGGLSNATGWTVSGASPPSITGGQAVWSGSTGEIQWASSLTVGKWYKLEFDLVSYTSGNLAFRDGTTNTSIATAGAVAGRKTFFINATSNQIRFISFASATVTIDNISVREVPGNHAFQTSSSHRPTLARIPSSGRRNLLTRTEEFDNAAWTVSAASVSQNTLATTDPIGTNTADKLIENAANTRHEIYQTFTATAQPYTFSVYAKAAERSRIALTFAIGGSTVGATYDLTSSGSVVAFDGGVTATISSVGNGWFRCVMTVTATAAAHFPAIRLVSTGTTQIYLGDGTSGAYVWGAQLETGSTATNYQKVVATTDVTESGVGDLWHLVFDGSDDSLVTNSISFDTWTQETRRNLLTDTESFGTATWVKTNATVTENTVANPVNGETTADKLVETAATGFHSVYAAYTYGAGSVVTLSVYAKAAERSWLVIGSDNAAAEQVFFDLANGTVGNQGTGYVGSIASVGNGWYRCSVVITQATALPPNYVVIGMASANNTSSYAGDGTSGILIWGAQLETGSSATTYQRVGTDEMTVIAGVRKLVEGSYPIIAEFSANWTASNGTWSFSQNLNNGYAYSSQGSTGVTVLDTVPVAPVTNVITGLSDISSPTLVIRRNSSQITTSASSQGSGNYGNHILYIGRRGGSSLPYNGHLYQLIIRGKTTPTGKLLEAERFTARKAGLSI